MQSVISFLFLTLLSTACIAEDRPDKGWFFYEYDKIIKKEKPKPSPPPSPVDAVVIPEKKPMTAAWMKKMIPILEEKALDDPTEENVAALAYLIRTLGDKAQRYTNVRMDLIKSDPFLDMNNNVPFNGTERKEVISLATQEKQAAMKIIGKKAAGIFVFFDSKCSFCKTQISIVSRFAKYYNFDVMFVSVDGKGLPGATGWVKDNGTAKMLGIKMYPATFLALPPNTYIPISYGLMTVDQLEDSMFAASKAAKIIPENMIKNADPFNRGVLTLEDMKDGAYDDPEKFVKYVREKLKDRF
jgi:conjugal transfer pilus assembly protein TraF